MWRGSNLMRSDFDLIQRWIPEKSRILDLGCGDGSLLKHLQQTKHIQGYGLEIDPLNIEVCVENGINVIQQDLNLGLANFGDASFDVVLMTQALQTVNNPHVLLQDMLRIGKECVLTFPNFAYWKCRLYLAGKGRMPMSKTLPYQWYNTPNIHLCTFNDFEQLCFDDNIHILDRSVVGNDNQSNWLMNYWPNLFGAVAVYRVTR
jgi:methionine biosynthesis protein MetW